MADTASPILTQWSNFYVMTGSSAAALTGLMFVVISLVTNAQGRTTHDGVSTFNTPTVFHFSAALVISAVLSAPWPSLLPAAVLLGAGALYGIGYILTLMYRARRLRTYTPDLEDWVWFTWVPCVAYGTVLGGAIFLPTAAREALFALAGGALLLILLGIRNAWDVITFITIEEPDKPEL